MSEFYLGAIKWSQFSTCSVLFYERYFLHCFCLGHTTNINTIICNCIGYSKCTLLSTPIIFMGNFPTTIFNSTQGYVRRAAIYHFLDTRSELTVEIARRNLCIFVV